MRCPKYWSIGGRTLWNTPSHCTVSSVVEGVHLYTSVFVLLMRKLRVGYAGHLRQHTLGGFGIRGDKCNAQKISPAEAAEKTAFKAFSSTCGPLRVSLRVEHWWPPRK